MEKAKVDQWVKAKPPVQSENGAPSKSPPAESVTEELTALKTTLDRSEAGYKALIRHLRDGLAVYRAVDEGNDFVITDFNPAAEQMEKCRKEDILGRKVTEVFPGVIQFGLLDVFRRVWRTGRTERFPVRHYRDDRIDGWRDNLVYKLPSGEIVALYSDKTENKKFEESLKKSNDALRRAQQMARLGHWQYDAATRRLEWSDQMFALLGMDPALGVPSPKDQNDMVHPQDRKKITIAVCQAWQEGKDGDIVFRMFRKDRSLRWFNAQYHPQSNEAGEIIGLNGILLDITEIKEAELAKEMLELQLRRTQKMEAIGTITGGIAHDFNNILGIILGNAELAKDGTAAGSEERQNLTEIIQASLRAKEIIRQLLSFNKQSHGRLAPLDLGALVQDSLQFIRSVVPSNIEIRHAIAPTRAMILADAGQIRQLLLNLCTNAMHAMEADGGILEISVVDAKLDKALPAVGQGGGAGDYIYLGIRDTGQGIEQECMERIFDPYFTTKEVGKGSGLGLTVVHGIVQKHGAFITVESQKDQGSYFAVYFPKRQMDRETNESSHLQVELKGSESILLVDDEPSLLGAGGALLKRMGYRVLAVKNGGLALAAFQASPMGFDLVISDMTMPGLSGAQLSKKIRMIRPDIPIVLCTGFSDQMDPQKAQAMGVDYIEKPVDRNKLGRMVRQILDRAEARKAPQLGIVANELHRYPAA